MRLLGLSPLTLAAIAAVPTLLVVFLYAVKWQNRREVVGYVDLWKRVAARALERRGLQRLETLWSLLLQLAVVALLVLAVGRPRLDVQSKEGRAVVFVLDTSASMSTVEGRRARFDIARTRLERLIADLADRDEAALITTCPPEVVVPLSRTRSALVRATEAAHAVDGSGRLPEAMALARSALEAHKALHPDAPAWIHVISDGSESLGDAGGWPLAADVVNGATENVGITALGGRPDPINPATAAVLVEVGNFGTRRARAELRVGVDDHLLAVIPVDLEPGARLRKVLSEVAETDRGQLSARLERVQLAGGAADALAADNVAYAVMPRRGELPVRVSTQTNDFVVRALQANPRYRVEKVDLKTLDAAAGDVALVAAGPVPSKLSPGSYVLFAPDGGDLPFRRVGALERPSFTTWRQDHPVLRATSLPDVAVARSERVVLSSGASAVASYLDEPLIWTVDEGGRRAVVVGFDPADSNMPLRASFPVFLYNAIAWVTADRGAPMNLEAGRRVRWATTAKTVRGPEGELPVEKEEGALVFTPTRAGFYQIGDGTLRALSVADARESAIAGNKVVSQRPHGLGAPRLVDHELWSVLLLLALGIFCVEWWTYHRRITS